MTLNHRVVAMVGGVAKRVLCLTCNKQHNFRRPKAAEGAGSSVKEGASSAKTGKKAAAAPKATNAAREWQATVGERPSSEFVPYSIHRTFEPGQLVLHPKFGSGFVKETLASHKLCVMFKDGPKTLVHGMT
jgi:hypothetical protein